MNNSDIVVVMIDKEIDRCWRRGHEKNERIEEESIILVIDIAC